VNVAGGGAWNTVAGNWAAARPMHQYVDGDHVTFGNAAGGRSRWPARRARSTTVKRLQRNLHLSAPSRGSHRTLTQTGVRRLVLANLQHVHGRRSLNSGTIAANAAARTDASNYPFAVARDRRQPPHRRRRRRATGVAKVSLANRPDRGHQRGLLRQPGGPLRVLSLPGIPRRSPASSRPPVAAIENGNLNDRSGADATLTLAPPAATT